MPPPKARGNKPANRRANEDPLSRWILARVQDITSREHRRARKQPVRVWQFRKCRCRGAEGEIKGIPTNYSEDSGARKEPRRNSSPASPAPAKVWTSVNSAFGNCFQTPISSAVTVRQPNLYM